jgi:hypothetical protein
MFRLCECLVALAALAPCVMGQTKTLIRDRDPIVLVGTNLPTLTGLDPNHIVAFRYQNGWEQIPVQIDERKVVDFYQVYGYDPGGYPTTAYADANTYTGADEDPTFDADDELVFMARDAGDRAAAGAAIPSGVLGNSGVEIAVTDPLDGGSGYVYLFQTDGTLAPDAGRSYVSYSFNLLAGPYIPNFNVVTGPNPENSEVITPYYRTHFSDRWICDQLNLYAGGATGVDVLDRCKILQTPGDCGRSEQTFSVRANNWNGEGAFFVNKVGPIRGIRSYMGANSGILTQREHLFYEQRQDVITSLRVHGIASLMDFNDYSPQAAGMSYYNNLNLQGVLIDGIPDTVATGPVVWEMVAGAQGSVLTAHQAQTDIDPFLYTSFYSDNAHPSYVQCTGDAWEYGASGLWLYNPIPNTDPQLADQYGYVKHLTITRNVYYEAPNQTVQTATLRYSQSNAPLAAQVSNYVPSHRLSLITINPTWGQVQMDPAPVDANDPNAMLYPSGTTVTLTAAAVAGKAFREWTIFDPNHPDDSNFATVDANATTTIVMDTDRQVAAAFKCGSGAEQTLPLLVVGVAGLGVVSRRRRQRG